MRTFIAGLLMFGAAVLCMAGNGVNAQGDKKDDKEVTLKGKITCAKCDLGVTTKCATVIIVKGAKEGEKETVYYLDKKSHTKNHGTICQDKTRTGEITGVVSEEDGKKIITCKECKFDEKKE